MAEIQNRVLVVDDDEEARHLLVSLLRNRALIVDEAVDGEEALVHLRQNVYAVVLLDLLMPRLDGFAVLEAMRGEDVQSQPVVLVVTGADRGMVGRLDAQRIHGIVRKPFDAPELVALVVACAEIRGRGTFETMAMAMISGAPFLAMLDRL